MQRLTIFLVACVLMGNVGIAHATPIAFPTNTVDFSGSGTFDNQTYLEIIDAGQYTHDLGALSPQPQSLVTATLSITHAKNSNNNSEVWLSSSLGDIQIGILSDSNSTWFTDTFDLASIPGLFAEMESTSPWSLTIKLAETTNGADKIWMDKSVLSGTYEPVAQSTDEGDPELATVAVPEPSTVILMSLGLAGLGFARGRIKA